MIVAAIYARKSTEQSGADADATSVARQLENARAFALARGWAVADRHVYADDAISGADTRRLINRQRLLDAIGSGPPFHVLIMRDASRFSRRDGDEAFGELKRIAQAGVEIWFYQDGTRFTFGTFGDNVVGFVRAEMNAEYRRQIAKWTREAMERKARAGHVTGGRVFGYDNLRVDGHVERRINDEQAAIVRRIFELAATGLGQKRIAMRLNAEGAPAPRSQQGRPIGWAVSSVHEVLYRPLYRGELVWNRTRKRNQEGEKRVADRPVAEWLRVPVEGLRIVPEELWEAAHARIAEARGEYLTATKGLRGGRHRVDSKYLLVGLTRCTWCGGGLAVRTHGHGSGEHRRRAYFYACSSRYNRGVDACGNSVQTPMADIDRAVVESIRNILNADLVDGIITRLRQLLNPTRHDEQRDRLERELTAAKARVGRLTEAIAAGAGMVPELVNQLQEAHTRRQALATAFETIDEESASPRVDWAVTERRARRLLVEWRELLLRRTGEGRGLLRTLLEGRRVEFTPVMNAHERGYRFAGDAGVGGLLEGAVVSLRLASPPGFEPGFQP